MSKDNDIILKPLFTSDISITGRHARYLKELANPFDSDLSKGVFDRYIDVYMVAPIVGRLYNRKIKVSGSKIEKVREDKECSDDTSKENAQIFAEVVNKESEKLKFIYRTIVLLEDKYELEERCNIAFRYEKDVKKRAPFVTSFNGYVLGGIEKMYEEIIQKSKNTEDYVDNSYGFFMELNEIYVKGINVEEILESCKKTKI